MKHTIMVASLFSTGALANQLAQGLLSVYQNLTEAPDRALDVAQFRQYFVGYGCWCNFDGDGHNSVQGRGKPVDEWDANCKVLRDNYECIMMDAQDQGLVGDCIPWLRTYRPQSVREVFSNMGVEMKG